MTKDDNVKVMDAPHHISAHIRFSDLSFGIASCDDLYDGGWWLARIRIPDEYQGKGHGGALLEKLKETLRKKPDFEFLRVAPGGYGSDPKRLEHFYESHGFIREPGSDDAWRWAPAMELSEERKAELGRVLSQMEAAAATFYSMSIPIGFHQFLEFTGFMNEHIKVCRRALAAGIDFMENSPPLESFEAQYIGEKMGCIYSDIFKEDPVLIRAFNRKAFGVNVRVAKKSSREGVHGKVKVEGSQE